MSEKLEWFPFYWLKFLLAVNKWKSYEVGAYTLLLIHQWDKGFIPENESEIEEISGVSFKKLEKVMKKFEKIENKFFNKTLEVIRSEQMEKHVKNSNRGRNGAEERWRLHKENVAKAMLEQSVGNGNKSRVEYSRIEKEEKREKVFEVEIFPTFQDFWKLYNNPHDKKKCEKIWAKIPQIEREKIMVHLPNYVNSTPDKKFRKHPQTYLNNESWNNEIIISNGQQATNNPNSRLENAFADLQRLHGVPPKDTGNGT